MAKIYDAATAINLDDALTALDTSPELLAALTSALATVCGHAGHHSLDLEDVAWSAYAVLVDGEPREDDAKLSHAIGTIHGIALALGVDPLDLIGVAGAKSKPSDPRVVCRCPVAKCRWVGEDPDVLYRWANPEREPNVERNAAGMTPVHHCPACWKHDRKRVEVLVVQHVTPDTITDDQIRKLWRAHLIDSAERNQATRTYRNGIGLNMRMRARASCADLYNHTVDKGRS